MAMGGYNHGLMARPPSQVKSIHKQQTTLRKPIECASAAISGGREWAEIRRVLT